MKQSLLLLPFIVSMMTASSQATDTTKVKPPETWKKFHIAPRVGIGLQKSFFAEAGLAFQKYVFEERHGFMVLNIYSSFEWVPSTNGEKAVYGPKIGYEVVNNGGGGAIEIKYLSNGDKEDVVITPKLGFGLGVVNLFYGYNFSTNKYPFPRIRKHQFSLVINTNVFFYASRYEKK